MERIGLLDLIWICLKSEQIENTRNYNARHLALISHKDDVIIRTRISDYIRASLATLNIGSTYNKRVIIEKTINILKGTFKVTARKTYNDIFLKADLFPAGIVQLKDVLFAYEFHKSELLKSVRKLIAA